MREEEIIHRIRMISNRMRARGDANMKERGLTFSQFQVLIILNKHDGTMTQKELEREMKVSHPTMVGLLQRLEKSGYVVFKSDKNDKRIKIVKETKKAINFKEETKQRIHDMSVKMFKNLNDKDKEELYRMLNVINDDLNDGQGGLV